MPHRVHWLRALLLALLLHGQGWSATLTPFALNGIADSVIGLADGSLLFNDRTVLSSLYPRLLDHAVVCFRAQDIMTFLGTFGLFFTMFLLFMRFLPIIAISEVKGVTPQSDPHHPAGGAKFEEKDSDDE